MPYPFKVRCETIVLLKLHIELSEIMSKNVIVKKIHIDNYEELVKIIEGKTSFCNDLREKFIFRGVGDENYPLIPSALRENNKLDDFVDEDFKLTLSLTYEQAIEYGYIKKEHKYDGRKDFTVNKYGVLINENVKDYVKSMEEFQIRKELNALIKFLSYADKVGLKVPIKQNIRQLIEHDPRYLFNREYLWPNEEYFELISLAQHYGIPTRALDWSYDYKTALYFAVINIVNDDYPMKKPKNAILWAFNYKYFNWEFVPQYKTYSNNYYRPEYNSNPNLNSQKGLFTFMKKKVDESADESYDDFIKELIYNYPQIIRRMPKNEPAFYKFIIPEGEKPNILKELYFDGYSEEFLFPGYKGVTQTIKNRVKLEQIINNCK